MATQKRKSGSRRIAAPTTADAGPRLYAVGDIHGCREELAKLHDLIAADAAACATPAKTIVYLGDYIDRGPDSSAVIDLLLDRPLQDFTSIHLKGNHEDTLLRFLDGESVGPMWFSYGGLATLLSYGVRPPRSPHDPHELGRVREDLGRAVPKRHLAFFRGLRLSHDAGGYFFVHAGLRPGIDLDAQQPEDLMWIREPFLSSRRNFGRVVVHGHSISYAPDIKPNRIGIDTGAFASGRLTCLVADGATRAFIAT